MKNYYFTFSKHSDFKNQVIKVSAPNHKVAIESIKERTGNAWDMLYTEEQYAEVLKLEKKREIRKEKH